MMKYQEPHISRRNPNYRRVTLHNTIVPKTESERKQEGDKDNGICRRIHSRYATRAVSHTRAPSRPSAAHALTQTTTMPADAQTNFEQAVALSLHLWPALTLAVQNGWGGEDSADKRDWFAGAVSDLFAPFDKVVNAVAVPCADAAGSVPEEPDPPYVEEFLLQVMVDEFEVDIDDDSAYDVAKEIVRLRADCARGRFDDIAQLRSRWESRKGKKVAAVAQANPDADDDDDDDDDEDDDEGGGGRVNNDIDMDEAPQLVSAPKEKPPPEVDEDGFTKVTKKR